VIGLFLFPRKEGKKMRGDYCKVMTILVFLCFMVFARFQAATAALSYTVSGWSGDIIVSGYWYRDADARLNDLGQVLGWKQTESGDIVVYRWEGGEMTTLGTLDDYPTALYDINGLGHVVGAYWTELREQHAFRWTPEDGVVDLGTLPGHRTSLAYVINDLGQVVGVSTPLPFPLYFEHLFRWTPEDGMVDLGLPPDPDFIYVFVYGINNLGDFNFVGSSRCSFDFPHAFRWTEEAGAVRLDPAPQSCALAINDLGYAVGISAPDHFNAFLAYLWPPEGEGLRLGCLASRYRESRAYDINNLGQVVGWSWTESWEHHAFLWTEKKGMIDLNDLLPVGSGWELTVAHDINNRGQILAVGILNGEEYAVLLDPLMEIALDIKPGSCSNPLNVKSRGVLSVAILEGEDFDVTQVDPTTVLLEEVAPLRWAFEDVAAPSKCTEEGPDGFIDLGLEFDVQEVVAALGDVEDGDVLAMTLTGNLQEEFGGTPIQGEDVVVILKKGK